MQPESLNCPNCGAAVAADLPQCEFCHSRLKTVGCPACLKTMFLGSKFCGHCGADAALADVEETTGGDCPRCKVGLATLRIGEMPVRECGRCGGLWTRPELFERICSDKESQSAVLGYISNKPASSAAAAPVTYVPCPDCSQLMNRSNFARSSGVIVDMCKAHGVWFDAGELPRIIEFIDKGGLARAREKEKASLDDERSRIRDEQRRLEMIERRSGGGRFDAEAGSGLGDILRRLFDF